ncbi:MAG: acyltransferase [Burkholderiaceae bacterium]|nr:acyltransferase [Burkholderiaceae bacterium]
MNTATMAPNLARNPGLDYLRTASILIVLANHAFIGFFLPLGKAQWSGMTAYVSASAIISIEWLFVLSGYLIGTMMIRSFEKPGTWAQRARDFWLRRWFRTLPNYYLFLAINVLLVAVGIGHGQFDWTFVVFSQNLYQAEKIPHFFGESWSLAMDEWFYVLMPLLIGLALLAFRARVATAFLFAAAVLIVVPMVARAWHPVPPDFFAWDAQIRRLTLYHLDATGWGVLAAAVNRWAPHWWNRAVNTRALLGIALMIAGLAMVWRLTGTGWTPGLAGTFMNTLSTTCLGLGTLLVLPAVTRLPPVEGWANTFIERTSLYSYSIYLAHFPLIFVLTAALKLNSETSATVLAGVTVLWLTCVFALSALVFHAFEKPVSDLRERFTKAVSASPF